MVLIAELTPYKLRVFFYISAHTIPWQTVARYAPVAGPLPLHGSLHVHSFIFMDTDYRNALGSTYCNALTILSTVISRPTPTRAVVDAGLKSLSIDSGMPEPRGLSGITYRPGGDEHGILTWESDNVGANLPLEVGDRIEFVPSHIDTMVNLHNTYYAYRDGKLEAIWSVAARGKVQ